MENSFYNGMLNGLSKVKMGEVGRAQAELHMRRAATLVEMVMGSRAQPAAQAQAQAAQAEGARKEELRRAA